MSWLNPYRWILLAALAAAVFIGVPIIVHRYNDGLREEGRAEVREEVRIAAESQTESNRELGRMAERRYSLASSAREKFFTTTAREIHDAATPLAACSVPERVRLRLNAAAACARGDSEAACGSNAALPDTP